MIKRLTWDDIAELYEERAGGRARIQPMDTIFDWAESQPDVQLNDDGSLSMRETA